MLVFLLLFIGLGLGTKKNDKSMYINPSAKMELKTDWKWNWTDETEVPELSEINPIENNGKKGLREFKKQYKLIRDTDFVFSDYYLDTTLLSELKWRFSDMVSIPSNKNSIYTLWYHKSLYWAHCGGKNLFPKYDEFQSLQWYFLDVSDGWSIEVTIYDIKFFYKLYLLLGPHVEVLYFKRIKWKFIELLRFSEERNKKFDLFFEDLLDPLDLRPEKHYVHKNVRNLAIKDSEVHFLQFREETTISRIFITFRKDQIQWENFYLPYVQDFLQLTCIQFSVLQGETLNRIHNSERLPKLILKHIIVRDLDLRKFSNLKELTLINCDFDSLQQILLPPNVIVNTIDPIRILHPDLKQSPVHQQPQQLSLQSVDQQSLIQPENIVIQPVNIVKYLCLSFLFYYVFAH